WELFVGAFRFLKTDDVRLGHGQPRKETFLPFAERIDVPGNDAHIFVAAVYDRRPQFPRINSSAGIDRRYNSNSTPGFGTITSDPGNAATSWACVHATAAGSPCTSTIFFGASRFT
ncbi:MAG: hypothetical protein QOD12_2419, partial [Verrucomicrobiota bacterium]